jgi:hypothetical protein
MINFYNDRLAPRKLCELLSEVVPVKYHQPVVFSYGKRHMPEGYEKNLGVASDNRITLNLEAIAFWARCGSEHASSSAMVWRAMLHTGFHEFGHIALGHCRSDVLAHDRYADDWDFRRYCEDQADLNADTWIKAVLKNDSRLYQPNHLGVIDIIARRRRSRFRVEPMPCSARKDYRCHVTGGQLSIGDVFQSVFEGKHPLKQGRIYTLIHRCADDLARVYIDSRGWKHRFWVWGDVSIIAARLRKFFDGLTDAEVAGFYEPDKYEPPDNRIRDGQAIAPFSLRARLEELRRRRNGRGTS